MGVFSELSIQHQNDAEKTAGRRDRARQRQRERREEERRLRAATPFPDVKLLAKKKKRAANR
jgi:hypothetical protein